VSGAGGNDSVYARLPICILMQVISSRIKIHIEKSRIAFALFGDEWLYIKIQASPFSSCIDEVC
jgi:hypothetical protein